jgi:hypothetical protein
MNFRRLARVRVPRLVVLDARWVVGILIVLAIVAAGVAVLALSPGWGTVSPPQQITKH